MGIQCQSICRNLRGTHIRIFRTRLLTCTTERFLPRGGEDFYKPIIRRRCNEVTRDEMVSFYRGQETETKGESERSWRTSKGRVRVSLLRADTHSTWKSNSILHEMSLETLSLPLSFTRRFINSVSTET